MYTVQYVLGPINLPTKFFLFWSAAEISSEKFTHKDAISAVLNTVPGAAFPRLHIKFIFRVMYTNFVLLRRNTRTCTYRVLRVNQTICARCGILIRQQECSLSITLIAYLYICFCFASNRKRVSVLHFDVPSHRIWHRSCLVIFIRTIYIQLLRQHFIR